MAGGRPLKVRVPGSGEKIQAALRAVGLTWSSSKAFNPNHVLNNNRWARCGLPRSTATIANDIRLGAPVGRIDQYASFFGLLPEILFDASLDPYSAQFTCEVLKNKHKARVVNPLPLHTEDPVFCSMLGVYNNDENVAGFYGLLGGVFLLYLQELADQRIYKVVVHVHGVEKSHLLLKGYAQMHGVNVFIKGRLFRWGTFLHINYISEDAHILGYMMTHDPLMTLVSTYKDHLQLPLVGLAGSLSSPAVPDRFYGFAEKIATVPHETLGVTYERLISQISQDSLVSDNDPDYPGVSKKIALVRDNPALFHLS